MKVLQIIQKPQLRGAEIFACQLSSELTKEKHEVDVAYLFNHNSFDLEFDLNFYNMQAVAAKRFFDLKAFRNINAIIRKGKYDIVQANASDTLKYAALSKIIYNWKTPLVYRNANKIGDFINSKPKYWLNKFLISQLDHVISVSELCRHDFRQTFKYPANEIDTIPIGVNFRQVNHFPEDLKSIFDRGPILANVASLVAEKNHYGLLRIFKNVLAQVSNVQLLIIGKGKLQGELEILAQNLGVSDQVHFLGYRTDVLEIIKGASAFLLPSLIEGLPGVILEAQYCKTPVIANNVGGISEVVKTGKTGMLIDKGDQQAFSGAVIEILKNDSQVNEITEAAYCQVMEAYDNRVIAKRFLEVYESVIK